MHTQAVTFLSQRDILKMYIRSCHSFASNPSMPSHNFRIKFLIPCKSLVDPTGPPTCLCTLLMLYAPTPEPPFWSQICQFVPPRPTLFSPSSTRSSQLSDGWLSQLLCLSSAFPSFQMLASPLEAASCSPHSLPFCYIMALTPIRGPYLPVPCILLFPAIPLERNKDQ